jgi:Ring finger domain
MVKHGPRTLYSQQQPMIVASKSATAGRAPPKAPRPGMNANHGDSGTLLTTIPGGLVEGSGSGSGISGDQDGSLDRSDDEEQHDGDDAAAIPQVCLALAKDSRYLAHSEVLLMKMLKGWNVPLSVSVQKLLATILLNSPLLLVSSSSPTRRHTTRTTYGMEACGVDFASAAACEISSRRKLAIASIGLAAFYAYAESYLVQQESRRSTGIGIGNANNDNNKSFEALKGESRRNAYERQREKMIQGGTRLRSVVGQSQCNSDSSLRERLQSLQSSALRIFISAYKTVSTASPGFGGPHMRAGDESWDDTPPSTVLWLIRLHSALYLINGKYPTLLHRLVNIQLHNSQSRSKAGANAQQSEYVMMGLLLASFSFVVLLKIAAKSLVERVGSSRASSSSLLADSTTVSVSANSEAAARSCMICGAERRHPSCSVHCGHVFCWNCLHSWIQTRAKGCPLCKTPCSAHDVVYLRNYT